MTLILDISAVIIVVTAFIIVAIHAYWIYKLVTYDWTKFEQDSINDDFLKPYEQEYDERSKR